MTSLSHHALCDNKTCSGLGANDDGAIMFLVKRRVVLVVLPRNVMSDAKMKLCLRHLVSWNERFTPSLDICKVLCGLSEGSGAAAPAAEDDEDGGRGGRTSLSLTRIRRWQRRISRNVIFAIKM